MLHVNIVVNPGAKDPVVPVGVQLEYRSSTTVMVSNVTLPSLNTSKVADGDDPNAGDVGTDVISRMNDATYRVSVASSVTSFRFASSAVASALKVIGVVLDGVTWQLKSTGVSGISGIEPVVGPVMMQALFCSTTPLVPSIVRVPEPVFVTLKMIVELEPKLTGFGVGITCNSIVASITSSAIPAFADTGLLF